MRHSKLNKFEKKQNKKEKIRSEYYSNALSNKYTEEEINKIKKDTRVFVRSDGQLFCDSCIKDHNCGLYCWCCVDDGGFSRYEHLLRHIKLKHNQ